MPVKWFLGREPAALLALVAVAVKLVSAFWWHASVVHQAQVNTAAAALVAVGIALAAHDSLGPALLGALQAVLAAAVGFGLHWSADQQALVMSAAAALLAMWTRTQVTAKVSAAGQRVPSPVAPVQST